MRKEVCGLGIVVMLAMLTGCSNRIVGHRGIHASQWTGYLGVLGDLNQVTIQKGSRLDKLSIAGDGNEITVEDTVTLGKVEIWGEHNTVNVPERLLIREHQIGKNTIVRRKIGRPTGEVPAIEVYEPDNRMMGMPGETYGAQQVGSTTATGSSGLRPGVYPAPTNPAPQPAQQPAPQPVPQAEPQHAHP